MSRTLNQRMADAHEQDMAEVVCGRIQKGSGNQWHAQGDVKNGEHLTAYPITADCKATLGKSIGITRDMWDKIVEQTFGQNPALFLRWYKDESLREVDTDLVAVSVSLFAQILQDARSWQSLQDAVSSSDDELVPLEDVVRLVKTGKECLTHPPVQYVKVPVFSGCDCCR